MRYLKLMADYHCFPLWENSSDLVGNVDPASFPISENLISKLNEWAEIFNATLNLDDPVQSGFSSEKLKDEFHVKGRDLCLFLQSELGSDYSINYVQTKP
jgi:hypothetical protein